MPTSAGPSTNVISTSRASSANAVVRLSSSGASRGSTVRVTAAIGGLTTPAIAPMPMISRAAEVRPQRDDERRPAWRPGRGRCSTRISDGVPPVGEPAQRRRRRTRWRRRSRRRPARRSCRSRCRRAPPARTAAWPCRPAGGRRARRRTALPDAGRGRAGCGSDERLYVIAASAQLAGEVFATCEPDALVAVVDGERDLDGGRVLVGRVPTRRTTWTRVRIAPGQRERGGRRSPCWRHVRRSIDDRRRCSGRCRCRTTRRRR